MGSCVCKCRNAVHPLPETPYQHEASSTTCERREDTVRRESLGDVNVIPSIPPESFYPKVVGISREEEQCRATRRKMVAKETERPLRSLVEQTLNDWREGSVLGQIESHALSVPAECTTSVKTLASSLADPQAKYCKSLCESASFHLQIAKAYAIYFWIANNIRFCQNMWESFLSNPEDFESKAKPREVLRKRKYFSIGHANLFHGVATAAGLTACVVVGNLKVCRSLSSSLPDYQHFEPSRLNAHWWNMVCNCYPSIDCILVGYVYIYHQKCPGAITTMYIQNINFGSINTVSYH